MKIRNEIKNSALWLGIGACLILAAPTLAAPADMDGNAVIATKETAGSGLSLDAAVEMALENNPGLQEIAERVRAAEAIPSQAGSLPDPTLRFMASNLPTDTFDLDQEPMTQMRVGLSQSFPFPGKLRLRKEAAQYDAAALAFSFEGAEQILIRDIRKEWWNAFFIDRALEIVGRNLELLRGFIDIAGEKYAVGEGLQSDVILAQLELSKLLDLEIRLRAEKNTSSARLRAYLALPFGTPIRIPNSAPTDLEDLPGEGVLLQEAEQFSPVLAMEKTRINAADSRKKLAERDFYPDFNISADYGFRSGYDPVRNTDRADFATVGVGVTIPLYSGSKQSKALEQRRAEVQAYTLGLTRTRFAIQEKISVGLARYRQGVEQVELFETGIIPQARQTVEAMRAAYLVNEVDFLNLVSAQITLYNFETRYWQVLAEANQALAEIEAATGKENSHE